MTTYPLGYLTAAWIACEDIHPDCGPLVYYPGSHRLPYVFSKDVGITEHDLKQNGYTPYHVKYEPPHPRTRRTPPNRTALLRRAAVCHFFAKNAFVYHDLAAARSRQQYIGTCMLRDDTGKIRLL